MAEKDFNTDEYGYYIEEIENITEQVIEQEILNDIGEMRKDLVKNGDELITTAETYNEEINNIYNNTASIAENTIKEIENNIKQKIVDKGYAIQITDDGNGNADIALIMEVN